MYICINGKIFKEKNAKISVLDNGFLYGDGFYDTMRSYQGKILEHHQHLERLTTSANLMGITLAWSLVDIEKWTRLIVAKNKIKEGRVRVTVTRGSQGFDFLHCDHPTLVITAEELKVESGDYTKGVTAFTLSLQRTLPQIKTLGLTVMIQAYRSILPKGGYEAILVDGSGYVIEGASTNIFWIKNQVLYTTKKNMLNGLTRQRVINLAAKNKIKVKLVEAKVKVLYEADEIFLSNRPREIIPVIKIDQKKIGMGHPGPLTKKIMWLYHEHVVFSLGLK